MNIKDMHYDVKLKANKIDSQKYRNLQVPVIDWYLNEAQELFIKNLAQPRVRNHLGFEVNQRSIDDLKAIVIYNYSIPVNDNLAILPPDYMFYIGGKVKMQKGSCKGYSKFLKVRQTGDEFESSPFDKSSFEWRFVNITFHKDGIQFYTDETFTISDFFMTYIRKPIYMHNAEDFRGGKYKLGDGVELSGFADCELSEHTHREIVDIAVALISNNTENPNYNLKVDKLNQNSLR